MKFAGVFRKSTVFVAPFILVFALSFSLSACRKHSIRSVELELSNTNLVLSATNALQNFLTHILHINDEYDSGHLLIPRTGHIAVTLQDGRILIVGGSRGTSGEDVIETELIDTVNGTVTYAADANVRRNGPTGTLLTSGKVLVCGGANNAVGNLDTCEIYDPSANTWTPTASMSVKRSMHTSTLLSNGLVLIAGGGDAPTYWDTAELFDPAGNAGAGSFAATGSMPATLYGHQAVRLDTIGGKVLVAGGLQSYLYDPGAGTWAATIGGTQNFERNDHRMVVMANGKVLSVAGNIPFFGHSKKCEIFDPATETWTVTGDLTKERIQHSLTLLSNGKVLAVGGQASSGTTEVAELYDPALGTWSAAGTLPDPIQSHAATLLSDGRVMVIAGTQTFGSTFDRFVYYSPTSNSWSLNSPVNTIARYHHTSTKLADGRVLIVGGQGQNTELAGVQDTTVFFDSAQIYDPASQTWTTVDSLNVGRGYHTATLLASGRVLVTGGVDSNGMALDSAELYDPNSDTWILLPSTMSAPRYLSTATLLANGTVLIAGGMDNVPAVLDSTDIFNPATSTFVAGTPMGTPRYAHTATLLNSGSLLVVGGGDGVATLGTTEVYTAGVWAPGTALTNPRMHHTATKIANGDVVLVAGMDNWVGIDSIEVYHTNSTVTTLASTLQTTTFQHAAILLPNGNVLVTGGYDGATYYAVDIAQEINAGADTITATTIFPRGGRNGHTMTLLDDDRVLIHGGEDSSYVYHDAEFYQNAASVAIQASGCTGPYTYTLASGSGTLYSTGVYVPDQSAPEVALVTVTSAGGCSEDFVIETQ